MRKLILKAAVTASVATALALAPATAWADDVDCGECADVIDASWLAEEGEQAAQPTITQEGGEIDFMQQGVIYDGGIRFTWYSSNTCWHYRTDEWTAGDDGIYRDSEGYVVVASDDDMQGDVVSTPFGEGRVYDSGCGSGTIDVYTNF